MFRIQLTTRISGIWTAWRRLALLSALSVVLGPAAFAQPTDSTPPIFSAIDERGVDLLSGQIKFSTPSISIGQPGQGGLSYYGFYQPWNYRDNLAGTISGAGSVRRVSIGPSTESFTQSGSNWVSAQQTGSTLTFNSGAQEWTYTTGDGTVAKFSRTLGQLSSLYGTLEGLVTTITAPNGEVTTFDYSTVNVMYCPYPGGGCVASIDDPGGSGPPYEILETMIRLQSVRNNLGYQIFINYQMDAFGDLYNTIDYAPWRHLKEVIALNNAVEVCPGFFSQTCAPTNAWPKLTFASQPQFWKEVTDSLGRKTYSDYSGGAFTHRPPGAGAPLISVQINSTTFRVSSVTVGTSTWTYAYADASGQRTTTVTAPDTSTRVLVSNLTTGLPVSQTNELGKQTQLQHDSSGRLTELTYPEGNKVKYTYDGRGNITEFRRVAKPGSSLTDLVETASYPGTCSNPKTCNKPVWTKDTAGQQTDYTYDGTHGGLLTVTSPAATGGGTRPQQRYSYTQLYAWYLQGGSLAQAPAPVWKLTQTSACSSGTSPGCIGTVNEARTTIGYGAAGVANNRLPVSVTAANGSGTVTSTTARTFTSLGDIATIDGPLSGAADTSYYFYDVMRNPLGVITPDPDAGGPLLRRAAKLSYNSAGLVSTVEQGTATGTNLAALNGMFVLRRVETDYDTLQRPSATRLKSGSTILSLRQVSYDSLGRLDCEVLRMNAAAFGSPPSSACTLGTTGAHGPDRISKYVYNAGSQLTEITGAFGTAEAGPDVRYTYTDNGLQGTFQDEKGNRTTYVYDGFDRLYDLRYPHPSTLGTSSTTDYERYTYNSVGRLTGHRVRSGQTIAFAYDNLGRLTTRTPPAGQLATTYAYDLFGRTTSVGQTGHTVSFTFDALGRQLTEVSPQGTMSYQYDAAGRRTRATWPDSFYVLYDYDVTGAVTRIRENGASSGAGVLATYTYDNLGRLAHVARGNGVSTSMAFNTSSQLSSMAHDLAGTSQDQTLSFTYNMAGQILTRSMTNALHAPTGLTNLDHTFTVNGLDQYLTGAGVTFTHDARGSLTYDGTRTYAYDFDNRLTNVTGVGGAVALSYDPAGRLYQTAQTGGATTRFLYDGANLAAEYNGSNVLQKRYVHGPGLDNPVVAYTGTGTTSKVWLIADERGSVLAETNSSGAATQINTYDEYGIPASGNSGRFGFTGQMWIAEIEAFHYR
ncbi:RHS repeat protein, partial [Synechococcus moorigangaii CMS01]|nr:RHS repeat protein [Synechococcus moorigangaii CMS01]